jgi:hypothetical protein
VRTLTSRAILALLTLVPLSACLHDGGATDPGPAQACVSATANAAHASGEPQVLSVVGCGKIANRFTAEIAVRGSTAYTTTWGVRDAFGDVINIWDVSGAQPVLIDSVIVSDASTLGDVAVSDDGALLVVAMERVNGSLIVYDLADPRHPRQLSRLATAETFNGVHTAEIGRVNGKLYAFLAVDPLSGGSPSPPSKVVIVDLSDPVNPRQVFVKPVASAAPFVHDTFLRDGYLFVALWNQGVEIWDIGGGGRGTPENPAVIGSVATVGGDAHNVWWFHDPTISSQRYAFVGEEGGPAQIGLTSAGDIHVLDVSDLTRPREVAFFHVPGAGTHNFSVDEANGVLYAAYYNGGVRALDIRGDLASCTPAQQSTVGGITRCDLGAMGREIGRGLATGDPQVYIWGVQYTNGFVYASDMLSGLWKIQGVK